MKNIKFDKVIMNPPYKNTLHLDIITEVLNHITSEGVIINLSPTSWLEDGYAKFKKNSELNKYNKVFTYLSNLNIIDKCSNLFENTSFSSNLGIYKYTNQGGFNLGEYSNNSILDKVVNYSLQGNSLENYMGKDTDGFIVYVNRIYGGNWKNGGIIKPYGFKYEDDKLKKFITGNNGTIRFSTENEAVNFSKSAQTTFYSYLMFKHRDSIRWNTKLFPFMEDYTQPWTNERFCNYFGITGFISDTEAEPGSEWEEILTTMGDYM